MSAILSPFPCAMTGLGARVLESRNYGVLPSFTASQPPITWPEPAPLPAFPAPSSAASPPPPPAISSLPFQSPFIAVPEPPTEETEADFTDDDLREAFGPIVELAVRKAVYAQENGIDTYLEPMLRATIRRALAEYSPASRPFRAAGAFDRMMWHLQALFTSRTYEDIFFEKTHRFQVEEVFLVDAASLALVSFASSDPARHSSARRVGSTVQRIAMQLRDDEGNVRSSFEISDQRNAVSRQGKFVTLIAVVRGNPNELVIADLEFALRRIEDRFREQFKQEGSPLLHALQPFLEDCLLIQAPASAS